MKDYLLDIIRNTYDLGCFSAVKITGTDTATRLDAVSTDRNVIVSATFHSPVPEFQGVFGMPNLDKLKILLNLPAYQENAVLTLVKENRGGDAPEPTGIHFANATGDFQNDYRFMTSAVVNEKLKTAKPKKEPTWSLEFEPTVAGIQKLKMQAQAHSEEKLFQTKTDQGNLKLLFGDHSTHAGEFVFHSNVGGKLNKSWYWMVKETVSILDLAGDKTMRMGDEPVAEITVNSGLAVYKYLMLAQSK